MGLGFGFGPECWSIVYKGGVGSELVLRYRGLLVAHKFIFENRLID